MHNDNDLYNLVVRERLHDKYEKKKKIIQPLVGLEPTIPGLGDQCLIH